MEFIGHTARGVRQIIKDPGPLLLPPSAFSASSVYEDRPEYQAHKANLVVFASQEESSGAWCPAKPVQNRLNEWLQIEFDALKIMRILFTEGRGSNPGAYVPAFLIRYQRQNGQRWYDYRMRNGSKLLHASHNSQTIAIQLEPPIVARRFRIYPYSELEPRSMCLRLAVYGNAFDDGVVEYTIPEGDVYRLDPRIHAPLNDTYYDGSWSPHLPAAALSPGNQNSKGSLDSRTYLYGGLGLLMDKQYYEGTLPEPDGNHNVVGWFRRKQATPSGRITMSFTFDQVRNFTRLQIHALNSLNYVALFRRILVQFSMNGKQFDRRSAAIVKDIKRDAKSREARWISIPLDHRIGQFARIILWFDYDWIVISEISFNSELRHLPVLRLVAVDSIQHIRIPLTLCGASIHIGYTELTILAWSLLNFLIVSSFGLKEDFGTDVFEKERACEGFPVPNPQDASFEDVLEPALRISEPDLDELDEDLRFSDEDDSAKPEFAGKGLTPLSGLSQRGVDPPFESGDPAPMSGKRDSEHPAVKSALTVNGETNSDSNTPYIIAIVCCCLGSLAFASLFVFMVYRLRRYRQKRSKKIQKSQIQSAENAKQHQFLLANTQSSLPFQTASVPFTLPSTGNSFQYNQLKPMPAPSFQHDMQQPTVHESDIPFTTVNCPSHTLNGSVLTPQNLANIPISSLFTDQIGSNNYKPFSPTLDPDGLVTIQLIQQTPNVSSGFSSLGGLTLSRRGVQDGSSFSAHPFISVPPGGMFNLALSSATSVDLNRNNASAKLSFCPPPPPDQPLPPLPPPSTSPDCSQLSYQQNFIDRIPDGVFVTGTLSPTAPYAAAFPSQSLQPDGALGLPLDGSMPEYASASLFSGNCSVQHSSSYTNHTGQKSDVDVNKLRINNSETYCVPHQNSVHPPPGGMWIVNDQSSSHLAGLLKQQTSANAATPLSNQSEIPAESLDSSGMYYFANNPHQAVPSEPGGVIVPEKSRTMFLPFSTVQGVTVVSGWKDSSNVSRQPYQMTDKMRGGQNQWNDDNRCKNDGSDWSSQNPTQLPTNSRLPKKDPLSSRSEAKNDQKGKIRKPSILSTKR
ncbi:unnamed protein product [Calicophoron daubneyi]|uniref:F5/8 type C domain-containing protein n=1 Tax=Calicophoron daubneyi TaxID=300641 RepID=A0AAV2T8S6_CALDB